MKVLITGGAGFVGEHLVSSLLENDNIEIVVFDKLDRYPDPVKAKKIKYFKGNITNKQNIVDLFEKYEKFEIIYHLASEMPNKLANAKLMWDTNVIGTTNLIGEAVKKKAQHFVFISSNVT